MNIHAHIFDSFFILILHSLLLFADPTKIILEREEKRAYNKKNRNTQMVINQEFTFKCFQKKILFFYPLYNIIITLGFDTK